MVFVSGVSACVYVGGPRLGIFWSCILTSRVFWVDSLIFDLKTESLVYKEV